MLPWTSDAQAAGALLAVVLPLLAALWYCRDIASLTSFPVLPSAQLSKKGQAGSWQTATQLLEEARGPTARAVVLLWLCY